MSYNKSSWIMSLKNVLIFSIYIFFLIFPIYIYICVYIYIYIYIIYIYIYIYIHFGLEMLLVYGILIHFEPKKLKCSFSVPKWQDINKDFWSISNISVAKCFNATDAHYSVKIVFICFFSSSEMQKFYHLLGCHVIRINSSFNSFLSDLRFSNLICQVKRLAIFL